jgi:hypothetical protein
MFDVQFLNKKGCKLNMDLFNDLYKFWNTIHGKDKRSNLDMTANEFFDNAVKCSYSHDWLHTLIQNPPTYTKILKGEVDVDEEKFNNLSFEDKCNLVREEVYIMAFERFKNLDYRIAYSKMLKKFIMNHAPIWEAIFIIENYVELHKSKINFLKHLENEINRFEIIE